MRKQTRVRGYCILAGIAGLVAASARAELVYDNSTFDLATRFDPGTNEVGDEIVLGGSSRFVTDFTFQYWGVFSGDTNEMVRVRFYANDGTNSLSGPPVPNSVLFDSDWFPIAATVRSTLTFTDFVAGATIGLTGPVPNDFTWSVQFKGIESGESAGVDLYSPPTVGNNYDDYWDNDNGQWQLKTNGATPINFGARMDAVPEPPPFAIGILASAAILALRARRWRRP